MIGISNLDYHLSRYFAIFNQFFNLAIYIFPKVERAKSRGGDNMTWFQAFKIAFWVQGMNQAAGQTRRQPPNRTLHTPAAKEGTPWTRDMATTKHVGQENVVNLGSENKSDNNINTDSTDGDGDGYKTSLAVPNAPSLSPVSGSGSGQL